MHLRKISTVSAESDVSNISKNDESAKLDELKCVICLDILDGAVETSCGHAFCGRSLIRAQIILKARCMAELLTATYDGKCPTCREVITFVHPSFALRKVVDSMAKNDIRKKTSDNEIRKLDNRIQMIFAQRFGTSLPQLKQQQIRTRTTILNPQAQQSRAYWKIVSLIVILIALAWYFSLAADSELQKQATKVEKPKKQTPVKANKEVTKETKKNEKETPKEELPPLLEAAKIGNNTAILGFLHDGVSVDSRGKFGETALYIASREGKLESVKLLLEHNASIDFSTFDYGTPLYVASESGYLEIVEYLLSKGAKVNAAFKSGATPLVIACDKGYLQIAEILLKNGANVNAAGHRGDGPLHVVASRWHVDFIELLLRHKANVNALNEVGQTPVYQACRAGNLEVVKYLVEKGKADVFIKSKEMATPVYVAAEYGHSAVVRYLVTECNVDVESRLHTGATPVVIASQKGYLDIVRFLVEEAGANIHVTGAVLMNSLHLATIAGYVDIARLLLENGILVDATTASDDSAVKGNNPGMVNLLLKFGIDFSLKNKEGKTAQDYASPQIKQYFQGIRRMECKIVPDDEVQTLLKMNSISSVKELASRIEGLYNREVKEVFLIKKETREKLQISEKVHLEYFGLYEQLTFAVTLQDKKTISKKKLK